MKPGNFKIVTATIVSLAFLSQPLAMHSVSHSLAAAATVQPQVVKLTNNSYVTLRDVQFLNQTDGKTISFSLAYTNNEAYDLDLRDYWVKLRNKEGRTFSVNVSELDKNQTTIPSKSAKYITYYAKADSATETTELSFQVIKWDFNVAGFERNLGTIQPGLAETGETQPYSAKVMLYQSTKIRSALKQYSVSQDQTNMYLTMSFLVENVGYRSTDINKMKFFVQSSSSSVFDVTSGDLSKIMLQPSERKIITLYATVPKSLANQKMSLKVADSNETLNLPIGGFALPNVSTAEPAKIGETKPIFISEQPVQTSLIKAFASTNGEVTDLSFSFTLENVGNAVATVPEMEFYVKTEGNIYYPVSFNKSTLESLLPKIKKTVTLSAQIPSSLSEGNSTLLIQFKNEPGKYFPLANYHIQTTGEQTSANTLYTEDQLQVELQSVVRTSSTNNDYLVFDFIVNNPSDGSKQLPLLKGAVTIGGAEGELLELQKIDKVTFLSSKGSVRYRVYVPVEFSTSASVVSFALQEGQEETNLKQVGKFQNVRIQQPATVGSTDKYEISTVGNKAEVTVKSTAIYTGEEYDYFYAELVYQNKETWIASAQNIEGYLQVDGRNLPVDFTKVEQKIFPEGKTLLSAITRIPKSYNKAEAKFIIGQSANQETLPGAIGQPVAIELKAENIIQTESDFTEILFGEYLLNLESFSPTLKGDFDGYSFEGMNLNFFYDLFKVEEYENTYTDHKLLIEFVDFENETTIYSKELTFDPKSTTGTYLKEGENIRKTIYFEDSNIMSKLSHRKYWINVYHVYKDQQFKIASKDLIW
ncbi:hypothetical protein [Paenibacillus sp.]|uniref:hypothetical protein n=1 Tax=Paenibacillus sp. TaxID=58172 RepID=UPI002D4F5E78|nr:hypothetical protein [Paenibacillus sp.]HZG57509.1 hypothetical protein [Paenibacillus sp.]